MLKKALLLTAFTFSSLSNAGAILGNLNLESKDLNLNGVTLDTTMYRDDIASNALQYFTNDLNFSMYLDSGPQNTPYLNSGVYKTHDKKTGATIRSLFGSFTYDDNSFRGIFYTHGFECLQNTGILIPIYNPHNDVHLGFESECYKTVTHYELTLASLSPTSNLNYNNLLGTSGITTFNNTPTNVKITKSFYNKDKSLPVRDFDELYGSLGSLSVNHHLHSQANISSVYIAYVPETNALALFGLGLVGLFLTKRKKGH